MGDYTVTVVGATGKTGRHVARYAVERGWRVRSAGRSRPEHGEFEPFDWGDERSWVSAAAGSDAAYVLIPFNHPGAPERTPAVLEAFAGAGVGRIALLSSFDAPDAPEGSPLQRAEATVRGLGIAWASLRPTWFLDNFISGSFAAMIDEGELRLPAGEGKIPFVDARDVAAVAVAALAEDGPTGALPITGPVAVTHHEVAAAFQAVTGRPLRYSPVTTGEFVDLMAGRGFSTEYGTFLADALGRVASGELVIPAVDTVARFAGREPYTVEEFARHYA